MGNELEVSGSNKASKGLVSEAMLLTAAPFVGFAAAFCYEAGYLGHFEVEKWLIRLDLTHILLATAGVAFACMLANICLAMLPNRPWHLLVLLLVNPAFFLWFASVIARLTDWTPGWHLLLPGTLIVFTAGFSLHLLWATLLRPIFQKSPDTTVWQRWAKEVNRSVGFPERSIAGVLHTKMGPKINAVLSFVIFAGLGAYLVGAREARSQKSFLFEERHMCLAIRRYADELLCIGVDTLAQRVQPRVELLPISADIHLQRMKLDSLKVDWETGFERKVWAPRPLPDTLGQHPDTLTGALQPTER
jgi:hypothetical protein